MIYATAPLVRPRRCRSCRCCLSLLLVLLFLLLLALALLLLLLLLRVASLWLNRHVLFFLTAAVVRRGCLPWGVVVHGPSAHALPPVSWRRRVALVT